MTDLTALPWRTGRSQGRTIYVRTGGDDWEADTLIGTLDTRELAEEACAAHNAELLRKKAEASGPGFGTVGEDGKLVNSEGHSLWSMAVYLPDEREAEAVAWMNSGGLEVYRADKVSDIANRSA